MKSLSKGNLKQFLDSLSSKSRVYVPMEIDGVSRFAPWEKDKEVYLGQNTNLPPKELFFPQTEDLYHYEIHKEEGKVIPLEDEQEPFIVFGMRPCDVQSLKIMDDVFLTKGFQDIYYKEKREKGVIISLGCAEPGHLCFCDSWGVDPGNAALADIMMMESGDNYLLKAQSEAGEKLLSEMASQLADQSGELPKAKECSLKVTTEGLMERLQPMFEHSVWDEICRKCINCGTCTYLCPTCHCFDVLNRNRGKQGAKYRCYDSCMYPEYTLMAGGHNPRPTKKERVRQRFLHKMQYIPERYEEIGCVGCGRCIEKCPVNLDVTNVINRLWEVEMDG